MNASWHGAFATALCGLGALCAAVWLTHQVRVWRVGRRFLRAMGGSVSRAHATMAAGEAMARGQAKASAQFQFNVRRMLADVLREPRQDENGTGGSDGDEGPKVH